MGGPVSSPFGLRAAPAPPSPLTRPSAERVHNGRRGGVEVRQGQGRARRPQRSAGAAATSTDRVRTRAKRSLTLTGLLAASGEGAGTRAKPARPAREPPGGEGGVSRGAAPLWARPEAAQSSKTKKLHRACPVADLSSARFSGEAETTKRALVRIGRETGRMAAAIERGSSRRKWARDFLISRRQAHAGNASCRLWASVKNDLKNKNYFDEIISKTAMKSDCLTAEKS